MIVANRFQAVRRFGARWPGGIGPRMILERRRAQWPARLVPDGPEWVRLPSGLVVPALRGGSGGAYFNRYEHPAAIAFLLISNVSSTQSGVGLDSNYVYATSGDAIGSRFNLAAAETLDQVYFNVTGYTGTAANVTSLDLELRNNTSGTGPGTTLHESKTINPGSGTGWLKSTGWTFSFSADTPYWLVLGDANGNTTDFATVLRSTNAFASGRDWRSMAAQVTHPSTTWSISNQPPSLVLVFASGRVFGQPITASATTANNTNRRGWRLVAPAAFKVLGMVGIGSTALTTITGIELWEGSAGPSGTPTATGTLEVIGNSLSSVAGVGYLFAEAPTLTPAQSYRCVFAYAASASTPSKLSIGTGADATLRSALLGGGQWYFAGANGTTDWSNDDQNGIPSVDLLIEDFVASAGGGVVLKRPIYVR